MGIVVHAHLESPKAVSIWGIRHVETEANVLTLLRDLNIQVMLDFRQKVDYGVRAKSGGGGGGIKEID